MKSFRSIAATFILAASFAPPLLSVAKTGSEEESLGKLASSFERNVSEIISKADMPERLKIVCLTNGYVLSGAAISLKQDSSRQDFTLFYKNTEIARRALRELNRNDCMRGSQNSVLVDQLTDITAENLERDFQRLKREGAVTEVEVTVEEKAVRNRKGVKNV